MHIDLPFIYIKKKLGLILFLVLIYICSIVFRIT